ncbi:MAG: extracellular solute-binding protein [Clostridia bacterium]|nr:extracellular solute-binding protein [Clostridia bacterium]
MKKKQLPSLFYLTLLAAVTAGCSIQKTDQPKTEPQTTAEPPAAKAEIPLPEMDFGAAEYRILTAAEQWQSDYNAENTGDIIDDIIFQRNKNVEERYNIKLEYQIKNGWNAGVEEVRTALTGSVMGGTAEYDLMVGSVSYVSPRAVENLFRDLYDCDELDLSQPWWYPSINKEMEICGKLFLGAGSFGIATMDSAVMTYFNKQLVEDFHLDNPYQIVAEGKWKNMIYLD